MAGPTPRTALDRAKSTEERLSILESRLGVLPPRLSARGSEVDDWDAATAVGFYWSGDGYTGEVFFSDAPLPGVLIQERRKLGVPGIQRRSFNGATWSAWVRESVHLAGTAAERAAMTPGYWDFWQDTDGTERLYVGSKTGTWRQFSGSVVSPAAAWTTLQGTAPAAIVAGRSDTIVLDTVLETTENLRVVPTAIGTGYGGLALSSITRNLTNTTAVVRMTQLGSATIQQFTFTWEIIQSA